MKLNKTYIVIRKREDGYFLANYSNRKCVLGYEADWVNEVRGALTLSLDSYEEDKQTYESLAKAFGAEIIKVEASFSLTYPDGSEVKPIEVVEGNGWVDE
ncbi:MULTISPECIES: hypothetical protein [unclassified Facklamia]|uniref:hypothetical protein n=1 Tax=Aerococcaceae TaxID=186827 RepID=UPI0013B6CDE4|nr:MULTISPECIES: hypothetical protein [unclassified Facklamia]NEW65286.1 hypothetical protein [Facklamia sp. 252]NEW68734.1 hypothetical protein [Facklamia sp. 253]QQD66553.1 hypothetical protein JDW14_03180 [Aerococcaceae bacterium zg-252]